MEITDATTDLTLRLVIKDIPIPLPSKKALDVNLMLKTATQKSFEARELALRVIEYYERELNESAAYLAAIRSETPSMYDGAAAYHIANCAVIHDMMEWIRNKFKVYSTKISYEQSKK